MIENIKLSSVDCRLCNIYIRNNTVMRRKCCDIS